MAGMDLNSGALAPVVEEVHAEHLSVTGTIPQELNGMLIRNGPNPFSGRFSGDDVLDWWPEAAMLHGLRFEQGRVSSYTNRWVRTRNWADAMMAGNADDYVQTNPNVNVIKHAGSILALAEGGVPLAIDGALNTLGLPASHPGLTNGMTAHPKIDPGSGEMMTFQQAWMPPYLRYMVFDAQGQEIVNQIIDLPSPSMMHDMAITQTCSVFLDLSVSLDPALLAQGVRIPVRWYEDRPSRIGVLPRHGGQVRWFEIDPCFIQHVVNAFDDDGEIVLDVARYPWYFKFDPHKMAFASNPLANLWRYRLDPVRGTVQARQCSDEYIELPRVNESATGQAYRYLYAVVQPNQQEMRGVIKHDLETGTQTRHTVQPGDANSEPVFVARRGAIAEDDGWIFVCVYRRATDTTDVLILDAGDISGDPLAVVHLPVRVPAGFHGAWIEP